MADAAAPFVLFDDARSGGRPRLYRDPIEVVEARDPEDVRPALERLKQAERDGLHAAGFLAYEAGHALERKLAPLAVRAPEDGLPLLWFGLFERHEQAPPRLPDGAGAWASAPRPLIERSAYEAAVAKVKAHIEAGDIYQANLTFPAEVDVQGHPLALYAALRERARAGYGGIVHTGGHWLLSFSPELFFEMEAGRIAARPMKGTAARGRSADEDASIVEALRSDPKQRAENLMIVDLLRNDLSRVSRPGSVKVPALFEVETYPTIHQMTSTVTAALAGAGAAEVIEAIFPCGSVTGAPKIRAMEIIGDVERSPRGVYTGSIGWMAAGKASFNVAIRTLALRSGESRATLGLGSGIVADSEAGAEWRECLAKGAFVASQSEFDLIETMRFDPQEGFADLERHLARLKRSADAFGFPFDRHAARNDLQAATFRLREPRRIRLRVSRLGQVAIEGGRLPATPADPVAVRICPRPVDPEDFRLRHKTSDRAFYDEARAAAGCFEILFEDGQGYLTEGSFTNLFVERDGRLLTPPAARGLLPGVLRERLIEEGQAQEADLRAADLEGGFLIGNSLRGLIRAALAPEESLQTQFIRAGASSG